MGVDRARAPSVSLGVEQSDGRRGNQVTREIFTETLFFFDEHDGACARWSLSFIGKFLGSGLYLKFNLSTRN